VAAGLGNEEGVGRRAVSEEGKSTLLRIEVIRREYLRQAAELNPRNTLSAGRSRRNTRLFRRDRQGKSITGPRANERRSSSDAATEVGTYEMRRRGDKSFL